MMRDHGSQELPIRNRSLLSDQYPEHNQRYETDCHDKDVLAPVAVYRSHKRNFDDGHGSSQEPRHIELVEVSIDVANVFTIAYISTYIDAKDSPTMSSRRP